MKGMYRSGARLSNNLDSNEQEGGIIPPPPGSWGKIYSEGGGSINREGIEQEILPPPLPLSSDVNNSHKPS